MPHPQAQNDTSKHPHTLTTEVFSPQDIKAFDQSGVLCDIFHQM
jgi:hypothetical protein